MIAWTWLACAERAVPAGEPSGVMVHEGTMALFFPEDAVAAVPALAAWLTEHPGWHAVPSALDSPEVRGRLAATVCGAAATDVKGTVPWSSLSWVPADQVGYDREIREALAIPEVPAWVLPLGPDAAAPWRVLSTDVPPSPIATCHTTERAWLIQPTAVLEGLDRYGTLVVAIEDLRSLGGPNTGPATDRWATLGPGFHHALVNEVPWGLAIAAGVARLLSADGTVARARAVDGWWVGQDGARFWPVPPP